MPRSRSVPDLRECKTDAKRLLDALHADDTLESRAAAERFLRVLPWRETSANDLLNARGEVQLKHAQAVVAAERSYPDWKALKDASDVVWYPVGGSAFLNSWYARYADARECLEKSGGYLFTHRGQYFVCKGEFIRALGLNPDDPRWDAIGRDVAKPLDRRACDELRALAEAEARKPREAPKPIDPSRWPKWTQP